MTGPIFFATPTEWRAWLEAHPPLAQGRITPAGQAAYDIGKHRTGVYSYERAASEFAPEELAAFQANARPGRSTSPCPQAIASSPFTGFWPPRPRPPAPGAWPS